MQQSWQFNQKWNDIFTLSEKELKTCLSRPHVFTLHLTGFGKSLVKHRGSLRASDAPLAPVGSLEL